jgi:hypothetical protein
MEREDVLRMLRDKKINAAIRNQISSLTTLQTISFWNAVDSYLREGQHRSASTKKQIRAELISRYVAPTSAFYKSSRKDVQQLLVEYQKTESDSTLILISEVLLKQIMDYLHEYNTGKHIRKVLSYFNILISLCLC